MNTFWRILGYGIRAFRRNIWISTIAVVTMTMTLLTVSVFAFGDLVFRQEYQQFNDRIDYVIFLRDEASDADVANLLAQIRQRPEVRDVTLRNKEDVRKSFEDYFGQISELQGIITDQNNPLPREVTVRFHDPQQINAFNQFASQERFAQTIQGTSFSENATRINNYVRWTNFFKLIGVALMVFFLFISVLVVMNTLRLTIFSRRNEIEVMRFVGATSSYIRGPFIVEGILYGLLSAVLAALITWGLLAELQVLVRQGLSVGGRNPFDIFSAAVGGEGASSVVSLLTYLFILQITVGTALGVVCSIIAVRRYLKE